MTRESYRYLFHGLLPQAPSAWRLQQAIVALRDAEGKGAYLRGPEAYVEAEGYVASGRLGAGRVLLQGVGCDCIVVVASHKRVAVAAIGDALVEQLDMRQLRVLHLDAALQVLQDQGSVVAVPTPGGASDAELVGR